MHSGKKYTFFKNDTISSTGFKEEAGFLQNPPCKGWWSVLTPSTATWTVYNHQLLLYGKHWISNFGFSYRDDDKTGNFSLQYYVEATIYSPVANRLLASTDNLTKNAESSGLDSGSDSFRSTVMRSDHRVSLDKFIAQSFNREFSAEDKDKKRSENTEYGRQTWNWEYLVHIINW